MTLLGLALLTASGAGYLADRWWTAEIATGVAVAIAVTGALVAGLVG